jgi:hypothetical protein
MRCEICSAVKIHGSILVVWQVGIDISKEISAWIFRVEMKEAVKVSHAECSNCTVLLCNDHEGKDWIV